MTAIRIADSIVNTAVLIGVLLLLAVGVYSVWDSNWVYDAASAERYEVYKPTIADEGRSFAELHAINPEVIAWLTIYGTHIDYPVTQAEDNMKYVSMNVEGRYSLAGSIFLDEGSSSDFSDFSSIIYGHHMDKGVMFGEIGDFMDRVYFDLREYGAMYYGDRWHGLQFFAFLHVDAYNGAIFRVNIEGREEQREYLDRLLDMAVYTRDIGVTTEDRIVLLSTCSPIPTPTNGRDILIGRITDEVHGDPFAAEDGTDSTGGETAAAKTDWPRLIIILTTIAAVAILVIALNHRRGRGQALRGRRAR